MQRKDFIDVNRIVIKLGTNVLRNEDGEVALSRIYSFIEDISKLVKDGKEVIVVTSGAVGLGKTQYEVNKKYLIFLTCALFFVLISLPDKIEFNDTELNMCMKISKKIDSLLFV